MKSIDLEPGVSIAEASALLKEHSLLILRQALDSARVQTVAREAQDAFAELDAGRESLSDEDRRLLDRMEMPVPQQDRGFRLRLENYRVLDSSRLRSIIEGTVGPFLWHYPPMIRRQTPENTSAALPYHQDFSYTRHYPAS